MPGRTVVHLVPHTHWDREWYEPFEVYRFWLLRTFDRLRALLREDDAFRHFNFDGQTAAIEDYLAIRPEAEDDLAGLVRDGRLAIGPWRILMDEFLCSPETIVRNLQQARRTTERLGRSMRLGYIPDSFGHVAQMPQILRLAGGLTDACVWRGVPSACDRTVFHWEAPDGTRLRTLYLATSYSNGATMPADPDDAVVRARRIVADLAPFAPDGVVLALNGTDHRPPEEHLTQVVAAVNGRAEDVELRIGSLEEYLALAPAGDDLPLWRGELRSGARANLLMGVASARMQLKQAEFRASTLLERYAEPLSALAGTDYVRLLDRAWRWMVENSAHDSICGCGVDATADEVHARYVQAARIAELVATDGLEILASRVDATDVAPGQQAALVWNPSPFPRGGVAEVRLGGVEPPFAAVDPSGRPHPVQVVGEEVVTVVDMTLTAEQLARIVPTIHGRQMGPHFVNGVEVVDGEPALVLMRFGTAPEGDVDVEAEKRRVEALIRERPGATFRVLGQTDRVYTALVRMPALAGLGWTSLAPRVGGAALDDRETVTAHGARLDNGILRAEVRPDGAVDLLHVPTGTRYAGLLALEDGGDAGDEYNYSPPEHDSVVREPVAAATVETLEEGPLRAVLRVTTRYAIPASLSDDGLARSDKAVEHEVTTTLELRAGEPFLRARIAFENRAKDHRVRAVLPLPFRVDGSDADTAFHVTRRGLEAEGGPHEHGLPTYPCRRWVDVSDGERGLAVFHRGTPEYEVVDGGRAVAVTLLRSVAYLSRQSMRYRGGPAGPPFATPGAQCLGAHEAELAIFPHEGDWSDAEVHRVAETYAYPMRATVLRAHAGTLASEGAALAVEPSAVQLSAFRHDGDALTCRVYNASPEPVEATIALGAPLSASSAAVVDLYDQELAALAVEDGVVRLPLRGWEIATVRLS